MNRIRVWWVWRDVVIEIQTPAYQQTGIFNGKKHSTQNLQNEGLAGRTEYGKEYPAHPKILKILILTREAIATVEQQKGKMWRQLSQN